MRKITVPVRDFNRALIPAIWLLTCVGACAQEISTGESVTSTICRLIDAAADRHDLPAGFLTRLIWQESSFRTHVVSPAGAQGIAQFMPGTAGDRGLADPFDPEAAIPKAAEFLANLRQRFGNLGLAAAAYNGGATRVSNWRAGSGGLPAETRGYVATITGHSADDWNGDKAEEVAKDAAKRFEPRCVETVASIRRFDPRQYASSSFAAPWGVQLAGAFSKGAALAIYARTRQRFAAILGELEPMVLAHRLRNRGFSAYYRVRAPAQSRGEADKLCGRLHQVGGACAVLKSS